MFGLRRKKAKESSAEAGPMRVEDANCIIVEKYKRYLLVKRGGKTFHGWWCFPGGHAEAGETMRQAAQREANEEIGSVKVSPEPFMVFEHDWPPDRHTPEPHKHRCHAFRAEITGMLRAGDDAAELGWYTIDEAMNLQLTEYTYRILTEMKKQKKLFRFHIYL
jgi:ADP-ribose pyrophosphatase YjhB (NUDIX family)